jgi:hypothetical protein
MLKLLTTHLPALGLWLQRTTQPVWLPGAEHMIQIAPNLHFPLWTDDYSKLIPRISVVKTEFVDRWIILVFPKELPRLRAESVQIHGRNCRLGQVARKPYENGSEPAHNPRWLEAARLIQQWRSRARVTV